MTASFTVYFMHSTVGIVMDRIRIVGGSKLNGTIAISGAKNAALPLMIAGLLTEQTLVLDNVPRLADVAQLQRILGNHGVDIMSAGKRSGDRAYQGQTLHDGARGAEFNPGQRRARVDPNWSWNSTLAPPLSGALVHRSGLNSPRLAAP